MKKNYFLLTVVLCLNLINTVKAQTQEWSWAISVAKNQYVACNTIDNNGNVLITGSTTDATLTLGTQTITNPSPGVLFPYFIKYDNNGELLWFKTPNYDTSSIFGDNVINNIITDNLNNVYIIGYYNDFITFDDITINSNNLSEMTMFVFKFDSSGNVLWGKSVGGNQGFGETIQPMDIVVNDNNDIYISGRTQSQGINFGNGVSLSLTSGINFFTVKFNSEGNALWAKKVSGSGGSTSPGGYYIDIDGLGNIYCSGDFSNDQLLFDNNQSLNNTSNGDSDIFLVKYSPDGTIIYAKKYGSVNNETVHEISVKNNNIHLVGEYDNSFTLGNTTLLTSGYRDIFVAKFDLEGNAVWAKKAGGSNFDDSQSVTVDNDDNVYISGFYRSGDMSIGNTVFENSVTDAVNTFCAKFDSNGNFIWYKKPQATDARIYALNTDEDNNLFVSGTYNSSIIFDDTTLSTDDEVNYSFLAKLPESNLNVPGFDKTGLTIYPNPTKGILYISNELINHNYSVLDISGKIIIHGNTNNNIIDVSMLSSGMYFITIDGKTAKFIKE